MGCRGAWGLFPAETSTSSSERSQILTWPGVNHDHELELCTQQPPLSGMHARPQARCPGRSGSAVSCRLNENNMGRMCVPSSNQLKNTFCTANFINANNMTTSLFEFYSVFFLVQSKVPRASLSFLGRAGNISVLHLV